MIFETIWGRWKSQIKHPNLYGQSGSHTTAMLSLENTSWNSTVQPKGIPTIWGVVTKDYKSIGLRLLKRSTAIQGRITNRVKPVRDNPEYLCKICGESFPQEWEYHELCPNCCCEIPFFSNRQFHRRTYWLDKLENDFDGVI